MSPETTVTTLARMAEIMAQQQHEMRQLLQHQQQMLEKLKPNTSTERRVEGISMPSYHGKIGESLQVFLQQVQLYFSAKNIDVNAADNQARLVAMVATNLKGQAAAWYTFHQGKFATLNALAEGLQAEFIPPDLQERLRAELFRLKQIQCENLEDYVAKFRQIICQVREMSDIDQITWFVNGLVTRTREEVAYRRCSTVSKAIAVALEFERSHGNIRSDQGSSRSHRDDRARDTATPVEIDSVHVRDISRDECRRRNFRCKRPGHRMNDCRSKPAFKKHGQFSNQRQHKVNAVQMQKPILDSSSSSKELMAFRTYNMNMAKVIKTSPMDSQHDLIRKEVEINGQRLVALIDCGANHNLMRPGIVFGPGIEHVASGESFDGRTNHDVTLREVSSPMIMDGNVYSGMVFTEYELSAAHDVILGKPWFTRYNPTINWRTHEIKVPAWLVAPDVIDKSRPRRTSTSTLY